MTKPPPARLVRMSTGVYETPDQRYRAEKHGRQFVLSEWTPTGKLRQIAPAFATLTDAYDWLRTTGRVA